MIGCPSVNVLYVDAKQARADDGQLCVYESSRRLTPSTPSSVSPSPTTPRLIPSTPSSVSHVLCFMFHALRCHLCFVCFVFRLPGERPCSVFLCFMFQG